MRQFGELTADVVDRDAGAAHHRLHHRIAEQLVELDLANHPPPHHPLP